MRVGEKVSRLTHYQEIARSVRAPATKKTMYKKVRIDRNTTIDEHRLIMQNHLGRKLSFNEVVHHIDGNKLNNSIENLELMSRAYHARHHIISGEIKINAKPRTKESRIKGAYSLSGLKPCEVIMIRFSNKKPKELMQEFNVSKFCVSRIRLNKSFKN